MAVAIIIIMINLFYITNNSQPSEQFVCSHAHTSYISLVFIRGRFVNGQEQKPQRWRPVNRGDVAGCEPSVRFIKNK